MKNKVEVSFIDDIDKDIYSSFAAISKRGESVNWREYVTVDPQVCHGAACFKGTRIMVSIVLDNLAAGAGAEDIQTSYPSLSKDCIRAALAYAAEVCREDIVAIPA